MSLSDKDRAQFLFEVLVREHHRLLLAYARSLSRNSQVAEDLVQQSFIIAWDKFGEYDIKRDFGAWLRGIIRFEYLHWVREKREVPLQEDQLASIDAQYAHWHSDESPQKDLISAVRACVKSLPSPFQRIVQLTYALGLTSPEAASEENVSEQTLRKRLQRARDKVADCLQRRFQFSPRS